MAKQRTHERESTGLVRVQPGQDPAIRRVRAGNGFRYIAAGGGPVSKADAERIQALAIPPAWKDVWIAADALAHIQAVGTDAANRRQYLYHADWSRRRDRGKFARALQLAAALPTARAQVTKTLRGDGATRERALATAFRLLDAAAPRIGSAEYLRRYGSRGLTTLRRSDAAVEGAVVSLAFQAKSGQHTELEIDDADLASVISELAAGRPRARLLWYWNGRRQTGLTTAELNAFIRTLTRAKVTAKDFRTLQATIVAADALARIGATDGRREQAHAINLAVQVAADHLGNTRAVARSSYIDPRVLQQYRRGVLLDRSVAPETAIRSLLQTRR